MEIIEYSKKYEEFLGTSLRENKEFNNNLDSINPINIDHSFNFNALKEVESRIKDDSGKILIATINSKPVGFGLAYIGDKYRKVGFIGKLYVKEKYREQGIGRALILELEKYLKDLGCEYVMISTFSKNSTSYSLYKSLDYSDYINDLIKHL